MALSRIPGDDVDATSGRVRWQRVIHESVPTRPVRRKNSYASKTPVTDGQRVYVYLGHVGLCAYEKNGTLAWAKPMDAKNTGNEGYSAEGRSHHTQPSSDQSALSAATGSTWAARYAGLKTAITSTTASASSAPVHDHGSSTSTR